MTTTDRAAAQAPRPVIRTYGGVGDNIVQRHPVALVMLIACIALPPFGFYYALFTPWILIPFLVPLVILGAVMIWALPHTGKVPEKTLDTMFFGYVAALVAWPNYVALELPGLPWITFSRVIGIPMCFLLLVSLSTSPKFRRELAAILAGAPLVWKSIVAYLVMEAISLPMSHHIGTSVSAFLVQQTSQSAIFFMSCYVFRKPGRALVWASLLWALGILVSLMGLVEFVKQHVLWANQIPGILRVHDASVLATLAGSTRPATGQYRAQSVFSTSLGLSEFLALIIPFIIHFAATTNYRAIVRLGAAATILLFLVAILATDSRLGLFGLFLSVAFYVLFSAILAWKRRRTGLIGPAVVLAYPMMFAVAVFLSFAVGKIRNKVWGSGQYAASNEGRMQQLHMGIPKVLSHPIGHGVGMGGEALGFYNLGGTLTIDNYLLAVALEAGPIALVAFVMMFVSAGVSALTCVIRDENPRLEARLLLPLSIALLVFIVIKTVFAQDDNHPLLFMMMGITCSLLYRHAHLPPLEKTPGRASEAPSTARAR